MRKQKNQKRTIFFLPRPPPSQLSPRPLSLSLSLPLSPCSSAFSCFSQAYDRVPNPSARALGAKYVDSEEALLRESDVLSLHVPLNASTKHLINENSLRKLKPGAMIINVSRGGE